MRISDWSSDVCSSDLNCRRAGQVSFVVMPRGGQSSGEAGNTPGFQERERILRRSGNHLSRKYTAEARTDDIGITKIGFGVTDHHRINTGCVGSAQDGSKVTGFFNSFKNDQKRNVRKAKLVKSPRTVFGKGQ